MLSIDVYRNRPSAEQKIKSFKLQRANIWPFLTWLWRINVFHFLNLKGKHYVSTQRRAVWIYYCSCIPKVHFDINNLKSTLKFFRKNSLLSKENKILKMIRFLDKIKTLLKLWNIKHLFNNCSMETYRNIKLSCYWMKMDIVWKYALRYSRKIRLNPQRGLWKEPSPNFREIYLSSPTFFFPSLPPSLLYFLPSFL